MQQQPQQVESSFEFQQFLVGHYSFITQFSLINPVRHIQLELFMKNNDLKRQWMEYKEKQQQKEKEQQQQVQQEQQEKQQQQEQQEQQVINQSSLIQKQENNGIIQSQILQTQNNLQPQNIQQNYGEDDIKKYFNEKQEKYQIEQIIKFKDKYYLPKINKAKIIKTKKFLVSAGQDGSIIFWNLEKQMKAYQKNYQEAQEYHQRKLQQPNKLKIDYVHQGPFQQLNLSEQEMYAYGKYAPTPFEQGVINNACNCIANTDDIIVAGFADGNIMQWNIFFEEQNGKTEIKYIAKQLFSHNDEVNCIDLLQLDKRLLVASGSKDQSIMVQNFSSKQKCEKYQYHMDSSINQIQFLSKGNYQEVYCLTDKQIAIFKLENRLNYDLDYAEMFDFLIEMYQFPDGIISRFQLINEKIFILNAIVQCVELQIIKLHRDNKSNQTKDNNSNQNNDKIIYYINFQQNINAPPQFQTNQYQNQNNQTQNLQNQNQNQQNNDHESNFHQKISYVSTINIQKQVQHITQERLSQFTTWFQYDDSDHKLYTFDENYFFIFQFNNEITKITNKIQLEIPFKFDQIQFTEQGRIVDQKDKFKESRPYHTAIKTQKYYNGTTWFLGGDLLGKYLLE